MKAVVEDIVEVDNIRFAYATNQVFRSLSPKIPCGKVVAIHW